MRHDFCTQRGVDAFTAVLGTRQHHLGLGPGAGELRSPAGSGWGGRCRSRWFEGDQPRCAGAVPGAYLSWDGAATPPRAHVSGQLLSWGLDPALLSRLCLGGFPRVLPALPWTLQELPHPPLSLRKRLQHQPPDSTVTHRGGFATLPPPLLFRGTLTSCLTSASRTLIPWARGARGRDHRRPAALGSPDLFQFKHCGVKVFSLLWPLKPNV